MNLLHELLPKPMHMMLPSSSMPVSSQNVFVSVSNLSSMRKLFPNPSRVLHLKGFGRWLDFDDEDTDRAVQQIILFIKRWGVSVISWDGDPFQSGSFVLLLPQLVQEIP